MNKSAAIVVAIIVLGVLGVVAVSVAIPSPTTMTVTFYDANDNAVWVEKSRSGPFDFAFANGNGASIDHVTVEVSWSVQGTESGSSIDVNGDVIAKAFVRTISSSAAGSQTKTFAGNGVSGSKSVTFYLSDVILVESVGKSNGWSLIFECHLTATETVNGATRTAETTVSVSTNIDWSEEQLTISGNIGFL